MRLLKEQSALPRLLVFPLMVLAATAWFLLHYRPQTVLELANCPLRDFTGLPCPTCGGTQAAVSLAQGHWLAALLANPLVVGCAILLGVWSVYAILATAWPTLRRSITLGPKEKRTARILVVLLVVCTWWWEISRL